MSNVFNFSMDNEVRVASDYCRQACIMVKAVDLVTKTFVLKLSVELFQHTHAGQQLPSG